MNTSRGKALLNGLLAWFIGFALYMLPAFVVAFRLAFEMGPQKQGSAAISQQISQKIATLYAGSWLLQVGLIVIIGLLVVWRAWAVAKGSEQRQLVSGLIVGSCASGANAGAPGVGRIWLGGHCSDAGLPGCRCDRWVPGEGAVQVIRKGEK